MRRLHLDDACDHNAAPLLDCSGSIVTTFTRSWCWDPHVGVRIGEARHPKTRYVKMTSPCTLLQSSCEETVGCVGPNLLRGGCGVIRLHEAHSVYHHLRLQRLQLLRYNQGAPLEFPHTTVWPWPTFATYFRSQICIRAARYRSCRFALPCTVPSNDPL